MFFSRSRQPAHEQPVDEYERRSRLAAIEAVQRRDPYAFGRGDQPRRRGRGRLSRSG